MILQELFESLGTGGTTVKLTDLYDQYELHDERETLYHFIESEDLEREFVVREMTPAQARTYVTANDDMTAYDAYRQFATKDQRQLVRSKVKNFDYSRIIVVMNKSVIDGNHQLVAGILAKQPVKFIDLADYAESN